MAMHIVLVGLWQQLVLMMVGKGNKGSILGGGINKGERSGLVVAGARGWELNWLFRY